MVSGYQQQPVGDGRVRFTVTPAAAPRVFVGLGLAIGLAVVIALTTPRHAGVLELAARGALAGLGGWWAKRIADRWVVGRVDRRRAPGGTFVVSPSSIETHDVSIARGRLGRLLVRNGFARHARATAVSWMLCAEAEGSSTTLAGGMTESTARGLLVDVSRILRIG